MKLAIFFVFLSQVFLWGGSYILGQLHYTSWMAAPLGITITLGTVGGVVAALIRLGVVIEGK